MEAEIIYKLLVVDDEPQITRVLNSALISSGYEVKVAYSGDAALEVLSVWRPDMLITDLAMPEMDGVELCRVVRKFSDIPILVLSVREQERHKIEALDAGADDYVTKPFSIQELLARVRAHIRRQIAGKNEIQASLVIGDFFIDREKRLVRVNEKEVHLTPKEFDLLLFMAERPERVLTHRVLLTTIWGASGLNQPENLRVLVGQLRKKIEPGPQPRYILNEPWVGYRFQPISSPETSL